jgi:hypothetical protein
MRLEGEPKLSNRDMEMAQQFGGADREDYDSNDQLNYCDKGNHKLSSMYHQPNHLHHWQKEEREIRSGKTNQH